MAKDFWTEAYDLRTPVEESRDKRSAKARRKKVRVVQTRRPTRAS